MELTELAEKLYGEFKSQASELRRIRQDIPKNIEGIEKIALSLDYKQVITDIRNIPATPINQNTVNEYSNWYRRVLTSTSTFISKLNHRRDNASRNEKSAFEIPIKAIKMLRDSFDEYLAPIPISVIGKDRVKAEFVLPEEILGGSLTKYSLAIKEVSLLNNKQIEVENEEISKNLVALRAKQFNSFVLENYSNYEDKSIFEQMSIFKDFDEQFISTNLDLLTRYSDMLATRVCPKDRTDTIAIKKHILNLSLPESQRIEIMYSRFFSADAELTSETEHNLNQLISPESRKDLKAIIAQLERRPHEIRHKTSFFGSLIVHTPKPTGAMTQYYIEKNTNGTISNEYTRFAHKFYEWVHPTFLANRGKHYVRVDYQKIADFAKSLYRELDTIAKRKKDLKNQQFKFTGSQIDYAWQNKLHDSLVKDFGYKSVIGTKEEALERTYASALVDSVLFCDVMDKIHEVRFLSQDENKPSYSYENFKSIVHILDRTRKEK